MGVAMQWNGMWVVLALVVVLVGVLIVLRNLRRSQVALESDEFAEKTKYGLPIIPREDRQLPDRSPKLLIDDQISDQEDALSSMAAAVASAPIISHDLHTTTPTSSDVQPMRAHASTKSDADEHLLAEEVDADEEKLWQDDASDENAAQQTADMAFQKQSPVLDRHLDERQAFDQNNDPLLHATETVSIAIMPRNSFAGLPGKTVLEIVRTYGMKYGVMNLFHRYENEDGTGDLWFSMMGVGHEGVRAFDLNSLPEDHFMGLTVFLPLPHPHALRGFDSMVSVANMIAQDLSADMLDEQGNLFDDTYFAKLRSVVAEQHGQ